MKCNLCDSTDLILRHKGNIDFSKLKRFSQYDLYGDIYQCQKCSLVIQKLEHDLETINKKLKEESYLDEEIGNLNIDEKFRQFDILIKIIKKYGSLKGVKLFDAGANTGVFLKQVQQYTENIKGVEPSKDAVIAAKNLFDITIDNNLINETKIIDSDFDIITMWDVIEHLFDPKQDLTFLHDKLKLEGKIFISTHNIGDLYTKIKGDKYPLYMYQHFFHFSKKTLKKMLEEVGFEVLGTHSFCKSWTLGYIYQLYQKQTQGVIGNLIKAILKLIVSNSYLSSLRVIFPIPHFFVIVAKRVDNSVRSGAH